MRTVRVAVIGVGMWGTVHVRAYTQHASAELVAVCDLNEERVRETAKSWSIPSHYTSLDEMLKNEELDAVSVATPDHAHTDIAIRCAQAGLHVLCEKPMATTVAECKAMIAAAKEHEVRLMVDWHNRWNPPVYAAWQSVREGELGDVRYVYYRLSDTVYVPLEMLPWAGESNVMLFLGSHAMDTACWLMAKRPVRVTCRRREGALKAMGAETPDLYLTVIDFEDGAIAVIENSWLLPQSSASLIDHKAEIIGTKGTIYLDPTHCRSIEKYSDKTSAGFPHPSYPDVFVGPEVHGRQVGLAVESIYHFVECVRDGRPPLASGEDGLLNTKLITAAEQSAADNSTPVEIA
jgi:predicted dehydrogenase